MGDIGTDPELGSDIGTFYPGGLVNSDTGVLDAVCHCLAFRTLLRWCNVAPGRVDI